MALAMAWAVSGCVDVFVRVTYNTNKIFTCNCVCSHKFILRVLLRVSQSKRIVEHNFHPIDLKTVAPQKLSSLSRDTIE